MSSGCRVASIIGIIIGALIIVGIVLSYVFCGQIQEALVSKTINTLEQKVLADLPGDYKAEDIKEQFSKFKTAVLKQMKEKTLNSEEVQRMATQLQTAMQDDKIDKEELDKLLKMMKDIVKQE